MVKLMVIADDFTGALDTGVQFHAKGTILRFGTDKNKLFSDLEDVNVLIVDTETRHMKPEDAAEEIRAIVSEATRIGIGCIYKKTDSGLRGNIGSELAAALETSGNSVLHFIPAFPKLNRITREGIHYINGVPVAQSVFGSDPFDPVKHSDIRDVIAEHSRVRVTLYRGSIPDAGIALYDAATDEDLKQIAQMLKEQDQLKLLSGCAGFAAVLPQLLELEPADDRLPDLVPKLVTVCGSINPITLEQLDTAEKNGVPRVRLNVVQKLDPSWIQSAEGSAAVAEWTGIAGRSKSMIVECDGLGQPDALEAYRKEHDMDLEQLRCQIAQTMGTVLKKMMDSGLDATMMVTGGDTLMAFMRQIGQEELVPISELTPGVVLSQIRYGGKTYNLLSKSGGFGSRDLLEELQNLLDTRQ